MPILDYLYPPKATPGAFVHLDLTDSHNAAVALGRRKGRSESNHDVKITRTNSARYDTWFVQFKSIASRTE